MPGVLVTGRPKAKAVAKACKGVRLQFKRFPGPGGNIRFGGITPTVENPLEKKMENKMETGFMRGGCRVPGLL